MTIGMDDAPPKYHDMLGRLLDYVKDNIDKSPDKVFRIKTKDIFNLVDMKYMSLQTVCTYIRLFVSNRGVFASSRGSGTNDHEMIFSYPKEIKPAYERMGFKSQKDYEDYMSGCRTVGEDLCSELKNKHEENKNNPDSLFYRSSFLKGLTGCDNKDNRQENEQ